MGKAKAKKEVKEGQGSSGEEEVREGGSQGKLHGTRKKMQWTRAMLKKLESIAPTLARTIVEESEGGSGSNKISSLLDRAMAVIHGAERPSTSADEHNNPTVKMEPPPVEAEEWEPSTSDSNRPTASGTTFEDLVAVAAETTRHRWTRTMR